MPGHGEVRAAAAAPRILYSGLLPRRQGRHDGDCACARGEPAAYGSGSEPALYDCDCGLFLDSAVSYDCDCGLFLDTARSYDCDCGLLLDSAHTYDCDCGLFSGGTPGLAASLNPGPWTIRQAGLFPVPLRGGWKAFFNPAGPAGIVTLNPDAQRVLAAFEAPSSPDQVAMHLPGLSPESASRAMFDLARVGLLGPASDATCSPSRPTTLSAWLHVTEACNLDCPYCYVLKRPKTMGREVGLCAVDKLVEAATRHGYSALKLKYAGGEPTLHFPLVQALHAHAARATAQAGLALDGLLLTNGVGVSGQILDFLARNRMRLMVSLDGGPSAHDRVRARRDGQSSYASVASTVERALAAGLRPTVSITLTALTLDGAAEAVAFALERGLPFNLNFYRECTAGEGNPSPLVPDLDPLVSAVRGILDMIGTYPDYPLSLAGILDRTRLDLPHDTACSAGRDYMAVNTRGQVSACQMLLEDPWADLADADPLDRIRRNGASVFAAPAEDSGCHACPWRAACAGGCPLMRDTTLHAHYCRAYQLLLPELVRLEARRLITAHFSQPSLSQ